MDCRSNRFCRSLAPADREVLCAHCTLRELAKGQVVYREDIAPYLVVIVRGVSITQTDFERGDIEHGDCPAFFINTNGLVLGGDGLFNPHPIARYRYIRYDCLTDGALGRIELDAARGLFETSPTFARALYLNMATAAGEACEFAAVLRANDVEQSVLYLLDYARRKRFHLTHQQIAQITGHSRVSVTRAIARIREYHPSVWQRYEEPGSEAET